jgi:hypothetical protein
MKASDTWERLDCQASSEYGIIQRVSLGAAFTVSVSHKPEPPPYRIARSFVLSSSVKDIHAVC